MRCLPSFFLFFLLDGAWTQECGIVNSNTVSVTAFQGFSQNDLPGFKPMNGGYVFQASDLPINWLSKFKYLKITLPTGTEVHGAKLVSPTDITSWKAQFTPLSDWALFQSVESGEAWTPDTPQEATTFFLNFDFIEGSSTAVEVIVPCTTPDSYVIGGSPDPIATTVPAPEPDCVCSTTDQSVTVQTTDGSEITLGQDGHYRLINFGADSTSDCQVRFNVAVQECGILSTCAWNYYLSVGADGETPDRLVLTQGSDGMFCAECHDIGSTSWGDIDNTDRCAFQTIDSDDSSEYVAFHEQCNIKVVYTETAFKRIEIPAEKYENSQGLCGNCDGFQNEIMEPEVFRTLYSVS